MDQASCRSTESYQLYSRGCRSPGNSFCSHNMAEMQEGIEELKELVRSSFELLADSSYRYGMMSIELPLILSWMLQPMAFRRKE